MHRARSLKKISNPRKAREESRFCKLLQLGVLSFGLLKNGHVGVGVFPQGEEVLVLGCEAHPPSTRDEWADVVCSLSLWSILR